VRGGGNYVKLWPRGEQNGSEKGMGILIGRNYPIMGARGTFVPI